MLFLIGLFSINLSFTQEQDSTTIDHIADSFPRVKSIEIPPFTLLNTDTIQLGQHDVLVCDSYTALGQAVVYDALHSFNSRRVDKFGGYLNIKINAAMAEIRQNGFNSDLKKLYIQIDPTTLTVYWTAVVGPSTDGRCYVSVDSRGSAGGGLPAVRKQIPRMHRIHDAQIPTKLLEFNENVPQCYTWDGERLDSVYRYINIQQHFFKYYDPRIGSEISLEDYVKAEKQVDSTLVSPVASPVPFKKNAANSNSYKKYTVKSGDTLSQIAEKFHTTPSKIRRANGLRSDVIRAGQTLKIPKV